MNLSIVLAGCLKKPERFDYLDKSITSIKKHLPEAEYIIGLDNTTEEQGNEVVKRYPYAKVFVHSNGLGYSWNHGMDLASNDLILQSEEDWMCSKCWNNRMAEDNFEAKVAYAMNVVDSQPNILFRLDNMSHDWYKPGHTDYAMDPGTGMMVHELKKVEDRKRWYEGWNPYYMSNHPHIKNKWFHKLVGRYAEKTELLNMLARNGVIGEKALSAIVPQTEFDICRKVILHPDTRVLYYASNAFYHVGDVQVRGN